MSPNRRIVLNTVVTYGRSIVSLAFNLFTARWVLVALGQTDYGLYGVVGSALSFLTFFNIVLSSSVTRYYAYSIGERDGSGVKPDGVTLEDWFNVAFALHFGLAVVVLLLGLVIGDYAINHWLVIPADRVQACVWVFRFSLLTTFVSIVTVPYCSMFTAYQYIAELAIFDFVRIAITFAGAYWLMTSNGDRLIWYACIMMFASCLVLLMLSISAYKKFPSCRLCLLKMCDFGKIANIASYAMWKLFGVVGWLFKQQGSAIAINLSFDAKANAAYAVANQFAAQTSALANSLVVAITPAVSTIAGEGNDERLRQMTIRFCKFAGMLTAFLAIPLAVESSYLLRLWLKNPPDMAGYLCVCLVVCLAMEAVTSGQVVALSARGKISQWQLVECLVLSSTCLATWIGYVLDCPFEFVGHVFVVASVLLVVVRFYYSKTLIGLDPVEAIREFFIPYVLVVFLGLSVALLVRIAIGESFLRFSLVFVCSSAVLAVASWLFVLDSAEREIVARLVRNARRRVHV